MSCTQNGMQGWKKRRRNSSASKKGEVEEGGKWSSSFFFFNTHTHKKKKKTSDPCQPCSLALPAYALGSLSVRSSAMAIPWLFLAPFCHRRKKGGKEEKKKNKAKSDWNGKDTPVRRHEKVIAVVILQLTKARMLIFPLFLIILLVLWHCFFFFFFYGYYWRKRQPKQPPVKSQAGSATKTLKEEVIRTRKGADTPQKKKKRGTINCTCNYFFLFWLIGF